MAKYSSDDFRPFRHESHKRPVTRRDFLAQGFLTGAAVVASPSIFGLLGRSQEAYAQAVDCGAAVGGAGRIPFICFDLAGGANIAGSNVMVGQQGGHAALLNESGYRKLGLPLEMTPLADPATVDLTLGLPFHNDSPFLRGILSRLTTPEARAKVNGAMICARSANDTGNNEHNPMYGINKAGADGGLVTLIGTRASESGGNSLAPMSQIDPEVRPTRVASPGEATGLVDTGRLVEIMGESGASDVMNAIEDVSGHKTGLMAGQGEDAALTARVQKAYEDSAVLVCQYSNPATLDPRLDPRIYTLLQGDGGIFTGTEIEDESEFRKTAAVMKLVCDGHAGAGTVEFRGYDYHDSTRATGERKDFIAGEAIGAALEYAHRAGTELMVYVFTDGSVSSDGQIDDSQDGGGKGVWRGDNSNTAGAFMLVMGRDEQPPLVAPSMQQIGWFRPDGNVETSSSEAANDPRSLAETVVLNYLALHGETARLDEVLPEHRIGAQPLSNLIAFEAIRPPST